MLHDLRYALRSLRSHPGFAAVAALTLALGIGANTAIFSVVNAVLLRPLPYHEPSRLVLLWHRGRASADRLRIAAPDVVDYRRQSRVFEDFAFINGASDVSLADQRRSDHVRVGRVTSNLFALLGVQMHLGRGFLPGEGILSAEPTTDSTARIPPAAVVLGHELWRLRYGGDSAVVGRMVRLADQQSVVVGVAPPGFVLHLPAEAGLAMDVDAWTPIRTELAELRRTDGRLQDQDSDNTGAVIGRLKPGVVLEQAQAEMDAIAARQRDAHAAYERDAIQIRVITMHADVVAPMRPTLLALMGAVGFVLLIACINVANLALGRAAGRQREMAVRTALGAGRWRLARQNLSESLVLASAGGILGVLLAQWGIGLLLRLRPAALSHVHVMGMDWRVFGFTAGTATLAALLFGLAPAIEAAFQDGTKTLRAHGRTDARGGRRQLRGALVIAEVALSIVLLAGAGLMLRSFVSLHQVHPGFDPRDVLTFRLSLAGGDRYPGPADRAQFLRELTTRLGALPTVEAVAVAGGLPLSGDLWTQPYGFAGQAPHEWQRNRADFRVVTSAYFRAIGSRLLEGRAFTPREDVIEERRVVIIDRKLAERLAPDGHAVGHLLGFPLDGAPVFAEVVGVVENVRHTTLWSEGRETIYVPYRQEASRDVAVTVRAHGEPTALVDAIRGEIRTLDSDIPVFGFRLMERYVADAMAPTRFLLIVTAVFASIAVLLAAVGLYGVVQFWVGQRIPEIGVRMALGARRHDVVRLFIGRGMLLAACGIGLGLLISLMTARLIARLLFGISPADPVTHLGIALLLAGVTWVACYLPARRAAQVDPIEALRSA